MKRKTSKKIIDTIKDKHIVPDPRWKINLRDYLYWGILACVVILSAAFFSLALLNIVDFDLELFCQLKVGKYLRLLIFSAPYLWTGLFIFCFVLGYLIFRKTKKGYRYNVLFVAGIILIIVSILGVGTHIARMNEKIEDQFSQRAPQFRKIILPRAERLLASGEGMIAGTVAQKEQEKFILETRNGKKWTILFDTNTKMGKERVLKNGEKVIVVGKKIDKNTFKAIGIKPLKRRGKNLLNKRFHPNKHLLLNRI
ncbi:MAG: hypothetical protein U9M90_03505 [Patescibacteria group bacterium]|nr:hypothetical protein [Patescibacteria group bacterium]